MPLQPECTSTAWFISMEELGWSKFHSSHGYYDSLYFNDHEIYDQFPWVGLMGYLSTTMLFNPYGSQDTPA